jgi:hypothetical protein
LIALLWRVLDGYRNVAEFWEEKEMGRRNNTPYFYAGKASFFD